MSETLDSGLKKALFNLNKYGLKPSNNELEELIKMEFVESVEEDGWIVSMKGLEYIARNFPKNRPIK